MAMQKTPVRTSSVDILGNFILRVRDVIRSRLTRQRTRVLQMVGSQGR